MIKKNFKSHSCFYETQWPRLMELQKHYIRACELQENEKFNLFSHWFRPEKKERLAAHREKINEHFRWMMRQQFGDDVQWVSMYVPRREFLRDAERGTGYQGQILQFVYWFKDEDNEQ